MALHQFREPAFAQSTTRFGVGISTQFLHRRRNQPTATGTTMQTKIYSIHLHTFLHVRNFFWVLGSLICSALICTRTTVHRSTPVLRTISANPEKGPKGAERFSSVSRPEKGVR